MMSISGQFTGLDMKNLIGAPLNAAADANLQMAETTAQFIQKVGFDEHGKIRTASFGYTQKENNPDGTVTDKEMNIDIPLLAITEAPNLQVDEVNVLFDMEVKETEKSESSLDGGGSFTGSVNFGIFKATVSGSVSSHSSNTRSSDNSAKYHVDVRATNHGTPEGLSRVLDIIAANLAPMTASSTVVDENGKALQGAAKERSEKIKALSAEGSRLESAVRASGENLSSSIDRIRKATVSLKNKYIVTMTNLIDQAEAESEEKQELITNASTIQGSFDDFTAAIADHIILAATAEGQGQTVDVTFDSVANLKGCSDTGEIINLTGSKKTEGGETDTILVAFKDGVVKQNAQYAAIEKRDANKEQYNQLLYGGTSSSGE